MTKFPYWQKTCLYLTAFTLLATLPFWFTNLDLSVAGEFYDPTAERAFPLKYAPFWYALYKLIPILSALVAIGSIAVITLSYLNERFTRLRRPAAAVFLTFLLGPGLLVNGVFKENYGRPRPQQVEVFGGPYPYVPPLVYGGYNKAKSFPSGHSSVGFAFIIFYFLLRRRKPKLANVAGLSTLVLGAATGMARIVGGGHFLSDVLWSFYLVTITAVIVEHFIVEKPATPSAKPTPKQKTFAVFSACILSTALVIWLLLSLPFEKKRSVPLDLTGISSINISSENGRYSTEFSNIDQPTLVIETEGYGLKPFVTERIQTTKTGSKLTLTIDANGFHREAQQTIRLSLPEKLKGNIEINYP